MIEPAPRVAFTALAFFFQGAPDATQTSFCRKIRFHDLRDAHATHMAASDVHPKVASERPGHSRVGITLDLCSHELPGMQDAAVAKVHAALQASADSSSMSPSVIGMMT